MSRNAHSDKNGVFGENARNGEQTPNKSEE